MSDLNLLRLWNIFNTLIGYKSCGTFTFQPRQQILPHLSLEFWSPKGCPSVQPGRRQAPLQAVVPQPQCPSAVGSRWTPSRDIPLPYPRCPWAAPARRRAGTFSQVMCEHAQNRARAPHRSSPVRSPGTGSVPSRETGTGQWQGQEEWRG